MKTHPTDTWTPEGWPSQFEAWAKEHRAALDMNGGNRGAANEMLNYWKGLWAKPISENGRVVSYRGLRPSYAELVDATAWMVMMEPETPWVAMFKVLSRRIESQRAREAARDLAKGRSEEAEEFRKLAGTIGKPTEAG